jgi:hypothetical protein
MRAAPHLDPLGRDTQVTGQHLTGEGVGDNEARAMRLELQA